MNDVLQSLNGEAVLSAQDIERILEDCNPGLSLYLAYVACCSRQISFLEVYLIGSKVMLLHSNYFANHQVCHSFDALI